MRYIIDTIFNEIRNNTLDSDGEMMIRVDGFEDVEIYETISRKLKNYFDKTGLKLEIKLAKNKWQYFKEKNPNSISLLYMEENKWVANQESITHYRNLHDYNVLVLLGTEDEEDKGGLRNCYTITPNSLVKKLKKQYHKVFSECIKDVNESEYVYIDSLYKHLFEFVAVDICKLSKIADSWENCISNIEDFKELFFANLSQWGLPNKMTNLPSLKALNKNVLRDEFNFIMRHMFNTVSAAQYKKYENKITLFEESDERINVYNDAWEGWENSDIKSFDELKTVLKNYIRGNNVEENKERLLTIDYGIIEAILDIKLTSGSKPKKSAPTNIKGEPLEVFTKALLITLSDIKDRNLEIERIVFNIRQAEIVTMYSEIESEEEMYYLQETWRNVCRHTNNVIEYINEAMWSIDEENIVDIECKPNKVFSAVNSMEYIESGIITAASSNKKINTISFKIECIDYEGNIIKNVSREFQWKFSKTSSWLYNFSDICSRLDEIEIVDRYIPITSINKIEQIIFSKSEEEFFDLYEESNLEFDLNLQEDVNNKFIKKTDMGGVEGKVLNGFNKLGEYYAKLIYMIDDIGIYGCLLQNNSNILSSVLDEYIKLGNLLVSESLPENLRWLIDDYIYAFSIISNSKSIDCDDEIRCSIVPAWHPATLEKLNDQKRFFLDGCIEWWNEQLLEDKRKKNLEEEISNLLEMSMIQSALDLFPSDRQQYYGSVSTFGAFSIYAEKDIENNNRLKDMIHKDAIYDDDFDAKENIRMNDNAKMIYGVIKDYLKAFPNTYNNLSIVFVNPADLQPIVAAVYKYIEDVRNVHIDEKIDICLKVLVKPENKGGRNYLAYWMDESFSHDNNINIHTYLNEYNNKDDLNKLLNGNNDIVFAMDLLKVNKLEFIRDDKDTSVSVKECRFPIVYKPSPVSDTAIKTKRRIELSQPQFRAAYVHTQVVRYIKNKDFIPNASFIAVREVYIDKDAQNIVHLLHNKGYWVVCVDSGMDGALLRNNDSDAEEYSIIGFSTGKGLYGQYNLTITARNSILKTVRKRLEARLNMLFHWENEKIKKASDFCLNEASYLDGISLLSAINRDDYNINEFMAYILTSIREKEKNTDSALRIVIHLDSYKHWFKCELEKDNENCRKRPDFLVLETKLDDSDKLLINATIVECKISTWGNSDGHKGKAIEQVERGIEVLSSIFNPHSSSIRRRYWYAQLYRALSFAQVTFSDNSSEFIRIASELRAILDGKFNITWKGEVLGFWLDMEGEEDIINEIDNYNIKIYDIPQKRIQQMLLKEEISTLAFSEIECDNIIDKEEYVERIRDKERDLDKEIEKLNNVNTTIENISDIETTNNTLEVESKTEENNKIEDLTMNDNNNNYDDSENIVVENNKETYDEVHEEIEVVSDESVASEVIVEEKSNDKDVTMKLEDVRVLIGKDKMSSNVYWEFGHRQLANRHLLITGTSGQGKTYGIQTMLYELSKSNVSSVIFDYTEGFRLNQLEKEFVDKMGDRIKQRVVKFENVPINPFKRQFLEFEGERFEEKDSDIASRFANIMAHVYKFGDQQTAAIFDAVRIGLSKYKENMNMRYFQEELELERQNNRSAQSVISKMQPFFYSIEFEENSDFDWKDVLYPDEPMATIFQLTNIDRDMQVIITELMLWDLWYYSTKNGSKEKPFVVVLDEAQNLSHKDKSPSCKILTEGRKFGWSAWYATQSLKVLDDEEVTRLLQSAFKLYFKPTDDEIAKISKQLEPTDGSRWINAVKNLQKGQCIVVGERITQNQSFGNSKPTITSVTAFGERS